jgi:hypothetical protein
VRITFPHQTPAVVEEFQIFGAATGETNLALAANGARARSFKPAEALMREIANVIDGKFGQTFAWRTREAREKSDPGAPPPWFEIEMPAESLIDRIVLSSDREALAHTDYLVEPGRATASGPRKYRVEVRGGDGAWREVANVDLSAKAPAAATAASQPDATRTLLTQLHRLLRDYTDTLPQPVFAGYFVPPVKTHLLGRGDPMAPRDEVFPNALTALKADLKLTSDSTDQERRLAFAAWLTDPERNPLSPRVLANRLWLHVFGHGIVDTPGDFGKAGAPPSHPELLDWLASDFIDSGWSLKALHRRIMTSEAYRRSAVHQKAAAEVDADNRWLWRMAPRRLEAEAVRDALLSVSGELNLQYGGPSFRPFTTSEYGATFYHLFDKGDPEFNRRTVYRMNINSGKEPLLDAFDCPDPSVKTPRRGVTTTPLQALGLMNGTFAQRQADRLAARIRREVGEDSGREVDRVYPIVFGRVPSPAERDRAVAAIRDRGLENLCWTLLNATEFVYVR